MESTRGRRLPMDRSGGPPTLILSASGVRYRGGEPQGRPLSLNRQPSRRTAGRRKHKTTSAVHHLEERRRNLACALMELKHGHIDRRFNRHTTPTESLGVSAAARGAGGGL